MRIYSLHKCHQVFIDVDRLYAGQFDASLLKNIVAAKHFILVLTEGSLDRWVGDDQCEDWVHKEVRCKGFSSAQLNLSSIGALRPAIQKEHYPHIRQVVRISGRISVAGGCAHYHALQWYSLGA